MQVSTWAKLTDRLYFKILKIWKWEKLNQLMVDVGILHVYA